MCSNRFTRRRHARCRPQISRARPTRRSRRTLPRPRSTLPPPQGQTRTGLRPPPRWSCSPMTTPRRGSWGRTTGPTPRGSPATAPGPPGGWSQAEALAAIRSWTPPSPCAGAPLGPAARPTAGRMSSCAAEIYLHLRRLQREWPPLGPLRDQLGWLACGCSPRAATWLGPAAAQGRLGPAPGPRPAGRPSGGQPSAEPKLFAGGSGEKYL